MTIQVKLVRLDAIQDAWSRNFDYSSYVTMAQQYGETPVSQAAWDTANAVLDADLIATMAVNRVER